MTGFRLSTLVAGGLLAGTIACGPAAWAQRTVSGSTGTTSGPADNSVTTLGTGGETPTSPHQTQVLRNKGGSAIQSEQANKGGPGEPGRPGATGTESGKTPQVAGISKGPTASSQ